MSSLSATFFDTTPAGVQWQAHDFNCEVLEDNDGEWMHVREIVKPIPFYAAPEEGEDAPRRLYQALVWIGDECPEGAR